MPWQQRGEKRYFYRNEWVEGRSQRLYLGSGEAAELAATAVELQKVRREIQARQQRQQQEAQLAAELPLQEFCEQTDLLLDAALVAAGYHQHARGEWRRKRVPKSTSGEARSTSEEASDADQRASGKTAGTR